MSILQSKVTDLTGFIGNFKATINSLNGKPAEKNKSIEVEIGNVVVCTGYKEFDASRIVHYGYGKLPNVITSFELEKMIVQDGLKQRMVKYPDMLQ